MKVLVIASLLAGVVRRYKPLPQIAVALGIDAVFASGAQATVNCGAVCRKPTS